MVEGGDNKKRERRRGKKVRGVHKNRKSAGRKRTHLLYACITYGP